MGTGPTPLAAPPAPAGVMGPAAAAPRLGRVRTRAAFAELARRGRRAAHGSLRVRAVPGGDRVSLALAVGRAVGTAVTRNRVKRRLRAAVQELAPAPGTYLVGAGPAAATATYRELRDDLAAALAELGALGPAAPTGRDHRERR